MPAEPPVPDGGAGPPPPLPQAEYNPHRRKDIRASPPWHQYAYHIDVLPKRLAALASHLHVGPGRSVLDYGCADLPYRHFFPNEVVYVGADLPGNPTATLSLAPDGTVPAADGSFDAVMSTQVLEHVADPGVYLAEAFRVLRPGGRMLLSTHGVFTYHPDPVDLWRWTGEGLRRAVTAAGFEVTHFEGIIGLLPTGLQLALDAVYWHVPRRIAPVLALVMQSLIRLADRMHGEESRARNAQVFALVAEKPAA